MRWLAIVNPAAGRAREAERLLRELVGLPDVDCEIARTACPGDATRLARGADGYDGVIAIGGDGTIAEVLQGLDLSRRRLAVLPAGHGNCLARDLAVHLPARALRALRDGACRPLDLMEVRVHRAGAVPEQRLCASTLSVGYVTDVVEFGRHRLSWLGRSAYAVAAMAVLPQEFVATFSADGEPRRELRCTGLVVNNTAHLANFRGFPDASVHDGLLDVMEQGYPWPRQMLHNLAVLSGSRAFGPTRLRQSRSECIELGQPRTLMADGELIRDVTRLEVRCRPAAVHCVVGTG
jgi:diacylglycerol kinase (ATP)